MRKLLFLIAVLSILNSCNYFKSPEELLIEKEWIISNVRGNINSNKYIDQAGHHYKKSEKHFTFNFKPYGVLVIGDYYGENETATWYWTDDDQSFLVIEGSIFEGKYYVSVESKELSLLYSENYRYTRALRFYTDDSKEWLTDEQIDRRRELYEESNKYN